MSTHRRELWAAFETDAADHEAFARGELPPKHQKSVSKATRDDAISMTALALLLASVLWSILGYFVYDGRLFRDADGATDVFSLCAIVLVAGVLPAVGVGWAVWTWVVHTRVVAKTARVDGVARLEEHRHRGMVVLRELRIGGRAFGVNERAFAVLREGSRYRVFYVPVGDVVVGIEPLDTD